MTILSLFQNFVVNHKSGDFEALFALLKYNSNSRLATQRKAKSFSNAFNTFKFIFNHNSLSDSKFKYLVDLMKKKYVSYWNQTLQQSHKLSFYHSIKNNYSHSAYLDSTSKILRRTLGKLRIGCHNLRVETGRYAKIPLGERICPFCSGNKIEDETHLLLDCRRYSPQRDIFLSKIATKNVDIRKLSHENLISQLMNRPLPSSPQPPFQSEAKCEVC